MWWTISSDKSFISHIVSFHSLPPSTTPSQVLITLTSNVHTHTHVVKTHLVCVIVQSYMMILLLWCADVEMRGRWCAASEPEVGRCEWMDWFGGVNCQLLKRRFSMEGDIIGKRVSWLWGIGVLNVWLKVSSKYIQRCGVVCSAWLWRGGELTPLAVSSSCLSFSFCSLLKLTLIPSALDTIRRATIAVVFGRCPSPPDPWGRSSSKTLDNWTIKNSWLSWRSNLLANLTAVEIDCGDPSHTIRVLNLLYTAPHASHAIR